MNIGLDFDDTYTRDPRAWNVFINLFRQRGHKVYVVTWRSEDESAEVIRALNGMVDGMFYTNRKAKQPFMFAQGICIDVWIDDNPSSILQDMEHYSAAGVWQ